MSNSLFNVYVIVMYLNDDCWSPLECLPFLLTVIVVNFNCYHIYFVGTLLQDFHVSFLLTVIH